THVVQQAGSDARAVQRQKRPPELSPDVCVTVPIFGTVCGSDAAKACSKIDLPGCDKVCKAFNCEKPAAPGALCPPGWRAAGSSSFKGQCCRTETENDRDCCPPDRI